MAIPSPKSPQNPKDPPDRVQVDLAETVNIESAAAVRLNVGSQTAEAPDGTAHRPITVRLSPASEDPRVHTEVALWDVIERSTHRLSFSRYLRFMDEVLKPGIRPDGPPPEPFQKRDSAYPRRYSVYGSDAYDLVREATNLFLMQETGRRDDISWTFQRRDEADTAALEAARLAYIELATKSADPRMIPYMALIRQKLAEVPIKSEFVLGTAPGEYGILRGRINSPAMIELIWSVLARAGNARADHERDRLALPEQAIGGTRRRPAAPGAGPAAAGG